MEPIRISDDFYDFVCRSLYYARLTIWRHHNHRIVCSITFLKALAAVLVVHPHLEMLEISNHKIGLLLFYASPLLLQNCRQKGSFPTWLRIIASGEMLVSLNRIVFDSPPPITNMIISRRL